MHSLLLRRLEEASSPLELTLVGLGFMGYGFLHRVSEVKGVTIPLVVTRDVDRARSFLASKGRETAVTSDVDEMRDNARRRIVSLWSSPEILRSIPFPVAVEMTGDIVYGAEVAMTALDSGKHVVTMNAELHATVGSFLKRYGAERGVIFTDAEGDQPGTLAALINESVFLGFKPLMAGNMKGFLDRAATPDSMADWARKYGLSLKQTTGFTDGTKLAIEMSLVANHFQMKTLTRGMYGHPAESTQDVLALFDWTAIPDSGCIDYVIGTSLPPGVFVVGEFQDPEQAGYLRYLKMGDGPQYLLQRPYHLCHLEALASVLGVAFFSEATIDNSLKPTTQVYGYAKRDVSPGETLDGIGGYYCYGLVENVDEASREHLPIGLLHGAVAARRLPKDSPISRQDVTLPDTVVTEIAMKEMS